MNKLMWLVKIAMSVMVISNVFTSCELFGGDKNKVSGGEVVWSIKNQTDNLVGTQPLIKDGRVYFIQDRRLKAYTLENGEKVWSSFLKEYGLADYSRKLLEDNGHLFIDLGGTIRAYNMDTGGVVWNTVTHSTPEEQVGFGFPIMSQNDTYLYAGRKGYVLKLRKSDGQIVYRYELNQLVPEGIEQGSTEPVISPFGDNILYVPASYWDDRNASYPEEASGGNIFAYNAITGELVWERHIEVTTPNPYPDVPGDSLTGSPFIEDIEVTKEAVVLLSGPSVFALNRFTGEILWETYFPNDGFDVGLAVEGNGVYIASVHWHATKLDLETGEIIWHRNIKFSNTSIPTVTNGRMYFNNSGGGGIWVLDTKDGSVIYHENTPHYQQDSFDVYISSLGIGEAYMVNVGSKYVYCLTVP